ncbi:septal ring lytic transglycosylase RlpA family protein, partial [Vulcaniibacterium tengchongense]
MRGALAAAAIAIGLSACAGAPKKSASGPAAAGDGGKVERAPLPGGRKKSPYAPAQEDPRTRGDYTAGGLYKPGVPDSLPDHVPDVDAIPEPEVVAEPRSPVGNRPVYTVLGKTYRVLDDPSGYVERGIASYYGQKFHRRRTSNLEVYDMYAFTAAHKTLPLPSFARVTNLDNGKSVVVRVNDRGPFHDGRIIDLSYAAAVKLGIHPHGTGRVEVRALTPDDPSARTRIAAAPAANGASAIDKLVAAMPGAGGRAAQAGEPARAAPAPARGDAHRFDMLQDGKPMSADEFDAWMKARKLSIATGKPAQPPAARLGRSEPQRRAAQASSPAAAAATTAAPAPAPAPG